jgi:hypothetical protein
MGRQGNSIEGASSGHRLQIEVYTAKSAKEKAASRRLLQFAKILKANQRLR